MPSGVKAKPNPDGNFNKNYKSVCCRAIYNLQPIAFTMYICYAKIRISTQFLSKLGYEHIKAASGDNTLITPYFLDEVLTQCELPDISIE